MVSRALCQYPLCPSLPRAIAAVLRIPPASPWKYALIARQAAIPAATESGPARSSGDVAALGGLQPVVGLGGAADLLQGGGLDQGEPGVSGHRGRRESGQPRQDRLHAGAVPGGIQWSRISVDASAMSPAAVACRMASDGVP